MFSTTERAVYKIKATVNYFTAARVIEIGPDLRTGHRPMKNHLFNNFLMASPCSIVPTGVGTIERKAKKTGKGKRIRVMMTHAHCFYNRCIVCSMRRLIPATCRSVSRINIRIMMIPMSATMIWSEYFRVNACIDLFQPNYDAEGGVYK